MLEDTNGTRYLDCAAGVAVDVLGHAHPRIVRRIADQAAKVMHVSNYFYNENILSPTSLLREDRSRSSVLP
jgi:acetylornithine/succinyldiaminopimelate/putrescine aminotransferase